MSADAGGLVPINTVASIIIGSIVGFATILTIVWNFSKTIATLKLTIDTQDKTIAAQDKKHAEDMKSLEIKLEQQKTERKDDIRDSLENQTKKFEVVQEQVDAIKSDIKDISSRVTQNDQQAKHHEDQIKEIKAILFDHFTKWSQRIEDRVEKLRQEFLGMFTAFHSHNNTNAGIGKDE